MQNVVTAGLSSWRAVAVNSAHHLECGVRVFPERGGSITAKNDRWNSALYESLRADYVEVFRVNEADEIVGYAHDPRFVGSGWTVDAERKSITVTGLHTRNRMGDRGLLTTGGEFYAAEYSMLERFIEWVTVGDVLDVLVRPGTNEIVGVIFG